MKNGRLFRILYILLERQNVTAPELARLLEVSVRTVYRDVEALSMAGVPICASAGKGGGISLMSGYTFDKALLSDDEQNQILFAIQSLQAADQNVDGLLKKLGGAFQKADTNWIEVDFSRWGMHRTDNRKFEQLRKAILEKRILHIKYCGTSGLISERDVKPLRLVFKDKHWYLQAFCMQAEAFRVFKISRITELSLYDVTFADSFRDIPSLDSDGPPMFSGTPLRLRFPSSMAFRVYDEFDRESIEPQPDGRLCVSVEFPLDGWVISYLLTFGTEIEILEPLYIREQIADYAKKIYDHHKT
ncbi:MAG: YafY family protein [Bacillota bacterium]|nr:YafY family protein [Bacillota bacterium]